MNASIRFKTITPPLLLVFVVACFELAPIVQAVGPDTEGSISGSNNGEGVGVLVSRTTGVWNTGTGFEALNQLTAGNQNTATGLRALFSDTSGGYNTATGVYSLYSNTIGFNNTATGAYSLTNNTTGSLNTANGFIALYKNTLGVGNTATGFAALYFNTEGGNNTANGSNALLYNTTGGGNTAIGQFGLYYNTTGNFNTAIGGDTLYFNTTGSNNIALGNGAGFNLTTGDNNIDIGNPGGAGDANTIRIGTVGTHTATAIAGINGVTVANGVGVIINPQGQLGTVVSSARFKEAIKPMDEASEAILALKPVTFHYKKELDPDGIPQFGLVVEQVEKVSPDLVARDADGKPYTVRYDAVNAMLLNEFLKEHRKVEELASTVANQQATIAWQQKEFQSAIEQQRREMETVVADLKEQNSKIQKVSAQLQLSKPTPQMTLNGP